MDKLYIKSVCFILAVVVFLVPLCGCRKTPQDLNTDTPQKNTIAETESMPRKARDGIQIILILGLDAYDVSENSSGYRNANRADFMQLLIIDESEKKVSHVQLNPDIIVSFTVPGISKKLETPIGLLASYGSGGSDSYLNVTSAVSQLLGGAKIDHYLSFTLDAIGLVNDMIGGVSVPKSPDLYDDANSENIVLRGTDAMAFFSSRDKEDITNELHVKRQQQYIHGLYAPFIAKTKDDDFLTKLSLQLGNSMTTDLTLSQLMLMFETLRTYTMETEIVTFPGEGINSSGTYQFYVDPQAVEDIMEELVY